jgi:hypothetical protein
MRTEDEARKCWCPHVRFLSDPDGRFAATNRVDSETELSETLAKPLGEINGTSRCIASECMAWRWGDVPNPNYPQHMATTEPPTVKSDTHGFCGLAGRP